ncbi:hypothetical protein D918_09926 [Trichuris suis]|nr:hypothetical protein D918_09926 [Trichuris suis]
MGYPGMTTEEFFLTVKKFMKSSGVFGCQTSFLWPLYGCGDLAQAFSRSCAVYGGVYCLRCPVQAWLTHEESGNVRAIVAHGKRIDCKYLVSSVEYIPRRLRRKLILKDDESFCRAILLTDSSLMPDVKSHVSLLNYLPGEGKQRVLVLETGYSALVSPPDIYIVYLWATEPSVESEHAIRSFVAKFFVMCDKESKPPPYERKPRVLWSAFYNHRCVKVANLVERTSCKNVIVTTPPGSEWDMDSIIRKVEGEFFQCLPGGPFFSQENLPPEAGPEVKMEEVFPTVRPGQ